jgi:hypothetical protein
MRQVMLSLEREFPVIRVYADLFGYYLTAQDVEMVVPSIIPLAQHLFWLNEKIPVEPVSEFDPTELLSNNRITVHFKIVPHLEPPKLLALGQFYQRPDGKYFFMPLVTPDTLDEKAYERLKSEVFVS